MGTTLNKARAMDQKTDCLENKTFDEIKVGQSAQITRTLARRDIELFAVVSGDRNPIVLDAEFAKTDMFGSTVANGMWGGSLIVAVLGTKLPGPGTILIDESLDFHAPIRIGDAVTVKVTVSKKAAKGNHITFDCLCTNQHGITVIDGEARVIAPKEKISRPEVRLPEVVFEERSAKFRRLIDIADDLEPVAMAVVHPVEKTTLEGAVVAAKRNLIVPILVGPEDKIRATARASAADISKFEIVDVPHSHAAAEKSVELVHAGRVAALMKGALHTDEFMHPIVSRSTGLRTERRMSHVFVMDIPNVARPLFISDAALNIAPDLATKKDIVQNAIDLARSIGIDLPKVAILSAVESILPHIPSTIEAAALSGMARRGQIAGGIVDGPLAFDNAISHEAARAKGIVSDVAGKADILIVPALEAGNMIAKQLVYLSDAQAAGVVMGARVPIVLTSRAGSIENRLASCAVAALVHHTTIEALQ